MKRAGFFAVIIFFLGFIFITQLILINRPLQDNDEGTYLTTFLLIHQGYPAYKETFLSQPPGFLLSVYPGFILFGKTVQAARITIGLWSLIGLLAIVWICIQVKIRWAAVLTLGILYLIPYYFNQTITFQSDVLVDVFSLISFAFVFQYINTQRFRWYIIAVIFLNLTFWTKYAFFPLPTFILILLPIVKNKKMLPSNIFILTFVALIVSILFFLIFIVPFGIPYIMSNTIGLRLAASQLSVSQFTLFTYIKHNSISFLLMVATGFLVIVRKESFRFPFLPFCIWASIIFTAFLFYKPLFPHHIAILIVPLVIFFSLSVSTWFKKYNRVYPLVVVCVLLIATIYHLVIVFKTPKSILTPEQQRAVTIINTYTLPNDSIVTDEEILNGVTGKLPPPQLSDVSYVRIASKNLSPEFFKQTIATNKPKLIIPWNGRLQSITSLPSVLNDYKPIAVVNNKIIYRRNN